MAKDETVVETRHGTSLQTDPNISSLTSHVLRPTSLNLALGPIAFCLFPKKSYFCLP